MRRSVALLLIVLFMSWLPAAWAATSTVQMKDNLFEPKTITVKVGDTIVFENVGVAPHTATAKDRSWDTKNVNAGEKAPITFSKAGTFDYICIYHESLGMVGTVVVEAASGASPKPAAPASPVASPTPASQPATDYLSSGATRTGEERPRYGPLVFAAAGLILAGAIGGAKLLRDKLPGSR